jgi:hypothetical protein
MLAGGASRRTEPPCGATAGRDPGQLRWVYQQLRGRIRVSRFTEAGDKVVVGLDPPVPATAANVITVRGGKIVFFGDYRNDAAALSTVGLTPSG